MANYKQKLKRNYGQIETDARGRAYSPQSSHNMNSSLKSSRIIDPIPSKSKEELLGVSSGLFSSFTPTLFKEKFITPKSTRSMKSHTSKLKPLIEIENLLGKKYSMNKIDSDREDISSHLKELKEELGQINTITRADQIRSRKIQHLENKIVKTSEDKSAMKNKLKQHMEIYSDFLSWMSNKKSSSVSSEQILSKLRSIGTTSPILTEQIRLAKLIRSKSFERNRLSPYNTLPFQIPIQTRRSMVSLLITQPKSPVMENSDYIKDLWKVFNRTKYILECKTK